MTLFLVLSLVGLSSCAPSRFFSGQSHTAFSSINNEPVLADQSTFWQTNTNAIWDELQHTSLTKLQAALANSKEETATGWLKLAIISKQSSTDTALLANQLIAWRKEYGSHAGNGLLPDNNMLTDLLNKTPPSHIALLLPLQGPYATHGKAVRDGFLSAYYAAFMKYNGQQTITFYDTSQTNNMNSLYQKALAQGATMIIGPLMKENVQALTQQSSFSVPTIELNYTDIWFGSLPTNLAQFGLSPHDEAKQAAEKARQAGHMQAIVIAPQNEWGQNIVKTVTAEWHTLGGTINDTFYFSPQSNLAQDIASLMHVDPKADRNKMKENNNKALLAQQRRQDFDVIFLFAQPQTARVIVPLLKYYYAEQIPIYATSIIYSGTPAPTKDADLNGVFFCDIPWVLTQQAEQGVHSNRLFAVGRDAYLLSHELPRLSTLPNFPIYGATGALSLNAKQQIYRRLPWTQIHDGQP